MATATPTPESPAPPVEWDTEDNTANCGRSITGAGRYLPGFEQTLGPEPFLFEALAKQPLSVE